MANESSQFWDTGAALGDGADTYSAAQWRQMARALFTTDRYSSEGVLAGLLNTLAVSGTTSPLSLTSGVALVNGIYYLNDSPLSITVPTPSNGTTKHRVVLQALWGSTQTVRAALISSPDGTNSYPALTQSDNSRWEIPLAGVTIDVLGAVTLEDQRDYAHYATALIFRRMGGSSTNWTTTGTTTYRVGGVKVQTGTITIEFDDDDSSDSKQVTFPSAYAQKPLIFLTVVNAADATKRLLSPTIESASATSVTIRGRRIDNSSDLTTTVDVQWTAVGPE